MIMAAHEASGSDAGAADEREVRELYRLLLTAWNQRQAGELADLFTADGAIVGFDGSQHNGSVDIETELGRIFAHHATPAFVSIVRGVKFLSPKAALLRAVVGMVKAGGTELLPGLNAIQTVVAVQQHHRWRIALFQNTPAAFHGRPEESEKLTEELSQVLRGSGS
jgi:uncharacterized protein (TIGR02246 family)